MLDRIKELLKVLHNFDTIVVISFPSQYEYSQKCENYNQYNLKSNMNIGNIYCA